MATRRERGVLVTLDAHDCAPKYQQIYRQIAHAIESGALAADDKLPSIRTLAGDLGVSVPTVDKAYLQLSTEGYVRNVPRSGYRVNRIDVSYFESADAGGSTALGRAQDLDLLFKSADDNHTNMERERYDFSYFDLQPGSFPRKVWAAIERDVTMDAPEHALESYPAIRGATPFQQSMERYLKRTRGVTCDPRQVVPMPGTEAALSALLQLTDRTRDVLACEEPGYMTFIQMARRNGYALAGVPVLQGHDAFFEALDRAKPRMVFTSPSHQFPTGAVMPLAQRIELIRWAKRNDAYIIEDDSCHEYRYDVGPIPSLQSLDAYGRVIYLGNFSKVLSPSLRVAYLVLPPTLLADYLSVFSRSHDSVPMLVQQTLARFVAEGHLDQHARKMATGNRKRHNVLLDCLRRQMGNDVSLLGIDAGMHLYATVHNGMSGQQLVHAARHHGATVYGTDGCWIDGQSEEGSVMLGFSSIDMADIPAGVAALRRAWFRDAANQPS